jgi:hypothetical protein
MALAPEDAFVPFRDCTEGVVGPAFPETDFKLRILHFSFLSYRVIHKFSCTRQLRRNLWDAPVDCRSAPAKNRVSAAVPGSLGIYPHMNLYPKMRDLPQMPEIAGTARRELEEGGQRASRPRGRRAAGPVLGSVILIER